MRFETAEISLLGDREDNQDRAAVLAAGPRVLMLVVDGMGGHAEGARAAEAAVESMRTSFEATAGQSDPADFLREAVARAHRDVVEIGADLPVGSRPRATFAACLVSGGQVAWAHVGDARVYVLGGGSVKARTRDHTPIESLLQEGLISEEEVSGHPMRHYVEYCLGGFADLPEISVGGPVDLGGGDLVLACSDGLWSGVPDGEIAASAASAGALEDWLARLASRAVRQTTPYADNTTAVALRMAQDSNHG